MNEIIDIQMKEAFQAVFPEYAARMELAKSDVELSALHEELVAECRMNLNSAIALSGGGLTATQGDVTLRLTPKLQKALAAARLNDVKKQVLDLMHNLGKISKLESPSPETLAPAMVGIGVFSFAGIAINDALALEAEADIIMAASTAMAASAPTISMAVVVAAILVVVAVLCTIIYLLATSRKCVILFVNELDKPVKFEAEHFVSGGPKTEFHTERIEPKIDNPEMGIFPGAGFVTADRKGGFYGTQFGFSYKYGTRRLAVGALCGLGADNQCWCAIDESAKKVSNSLNKAKNLHRKVSKDNIRLTIHCNSHRGNPAYFIARAHFA